MYIQLKIHLLQTWDNTFINYLEGDNLFKAFAIMEVFLV